MVKIILNGLIKSNFSIENRIFHGNIHECFNLQDGSVEQWVSTHYQLPYLATRFRIEFYILDVHSSRLICAKEIDIHSVSIEIIHASRPWTVAPHFSHDHIIHLWLGNLDFSTLLWRAFIVCCDRIHLNGFSNNNIGRSWKMGNERCNWDSETIEVEMFGIEN